MPPTEPKGESRWREPFAAEVAGEGSWPRAASTGLEGKGAVRQQTSSDPKTYIRTGWCRGQKHPYWVSTVRGSRQRTASEDGTDGRVSRRWTLRWMMGGWVSR